MNPETKLVSLQADGHPDESQLLLALERELSSDECAEIEQHLGSCGNCRARSEEMQRGILAFAEYREEQYIPSLPLPPNGFDGFLEKLRDAAGEKPRINLLTRIWQRLFTFFDFPGQIRWASGVAVVLVLILFWTEVLHPPAVSASELLTRAMVAQNPAASGGTLKPARIAHQKLQIRSERKTVVREFKWLVGVPIEQATWARQSDPLQWGAPMTAEGFAGWRGMLQEKSDEVKRSDEYFTIKTITSGAFIREASMVVRRADFHPVEQHLRFADDRQLDLTEVAFEIIDQSSEKQQTAAPSEMAQTDVRKPPLAEPVDPTHNLDETELQLRYTLFKHQWDLGEDLIIGRGPERVILSGVVSSREREEAMQAALNSLPDVQRLFRAPDAGLSGTAPPQHASTAGGRGGVQDPILKVELSEAFPSREELQSFVDGCLASSDAALSHAWVLKRLLDRYSSEAEQHLSPESQAKLQEMLRAHLAEVDRANTGLQSLIDLLPSSATSTPVAVSNWRTGIAALFALVQKQDSAVAALVVGTRANGMEPASAAGNFRRDHQTIDVIVRGSLRDLAREGAGLTRHE